MWDSKRDTDIKNRLLDSVGEGEGGMILEDSIKTCMLPYVKWSLVQVWGMALKAGALGQPWGMGWRGRWEGGSGWGTHVHPWLTHVSVWQKPPPQYCKVIRLQFKKKVSGKTSFSTYNYYYAGFNVITSIPFRELGSPSSVFWVFSTKIPFSVQSEANTSREHIISLNPLTGHKWSRVHWHCTVK